jgi:glycolate oxidase iron-sulfur subunit
VGCVTDPWFGRVNDATVALLERAGYGVEAPPAQTCCGALAAHGGAAAAARRMSVVNQRAFAGFDHVVATTAGCSAHLAGYSHWGATDLGERAIDAIVLVARAIETGDLPTLEPGGRRVAVHDPCHHRHAQGITEEPRAILRAAGFEPVDVDPSGMCCGAAGLYSLDHPDTAARLGSAKATEVLATGCDLVASANAGCEIQLRSHLGGSIRVAHPLEIYAEALGLIAPMAE